MHGQRNGFGRWTSASQLLGVPTNEEQGVVDADADAHEWDDVLDVDGQVRAARDEVQGAQRHDEGRERGDDRKRRCDERPQHQQQDQKDDGDLDQLRASQVLGVDCVEIVEDCRAAGDVDTDVLGRAGSRGRDDPVGLLQGVVEPRANPCEHIERPATTPTDRLGDLADEWVGRQQCVDAAGRDRQRSGVGRAVAERQHRRHRGGEVSAEALQNGGAGLFGCRARDFETTGRQFAAESGREYPEPHQHHEPCPDDPPASPYAQPAQAGEDTRDLGLGRGRRHPGTISGRRSEAVSVR